MSEPPVEPKLNDSPQNGLLIPPIAILLLAMTGYLLLFSIVYLIRYFCKSKGSCGEENCYCEGPDCCACIESCADACTCGTPTVNKCLDSCCAKRNLDCIGLILCQCCGTPNEPCCGNSHGPCCSYGDLNCNCACIQPDLESVNCLCCQIGTSNYNRANDLD